MFEINSSGYFSSTGQIIGQTVRRGDGLMFGMLEGVVRVWVSYLYSVIYSEQLSYMKVFHPGNVYRYRDLLTDGPGGGCRCLVR